MSNTSGNIATPGSKNTISTVEKSGKRKWQYVLQPKGRLYNRRTVTSIIYLIIFFGLPFISYKGEPLFLFNFPEATFIIFGKIFVPQDFVLMGIGMLVFLLIIIVFTLIFGRIFCGWACPQTIFMEMVFRKIEYWIEGPANKQRIADHKKWTTQLYVRKTIKHILFFALSFIIANTFLAYIIGLAELKKIIAEPVSQHVGGFLALLFFTIVFYIVYAFVREIVCTVICPYGRLQSVLLDKNSIIVSYDYKRGEPRDKNRKAALIDTGDCIDCKMCVQVCPTGIDIRNGTQLECINCTACIDACNMMMRAVQREEGLIRYASEENITNAQKLKMTPRIKAYSIFLILLTGILVVMLITRSLFDSTVLRVPGQLLQENADGTVSNLYRIKIVSKSRRTEPYRLELSGNDAHIEYVGKHLDSLHSGITSEETFFIKIPKDKIVKRKQFLTLNIKSDGDIIQQKTVSFIGDY